MWLSLLPRILSVLQTSKGFVCLVGIEEHDFSLTMHPGSVVVSLTVRQGYDDMGCPV